MSNNDNLLLLSLTESGDILIKQNQGKLNVLHIIIDISLSVISCAASYFLYKAIFYIDLLYEWHYNYPVIIAIVVITAALQIIFNRIFDLYRSYRSTRFIFEFTNLVKSGITMFAVLAGVALATSQLATCQLSIFFYFLCYTFLSGSYRFFLRKLLRYMRKKGYNKKTIVMIGLNNCTNNFINKIHSSPDLGYNILGYFGFEPDRKLPQIYLGNFDRLSEYFQLFHPDEALIMLSDKLEPQLGNIVDICESWGVKFSIIPNMFSNFSSRMYISSFDGIPVMSMRKVPLENSFNKFIKRSLDIIISVLMLIILSPLMLMTAVIIKLTSPGKVIFKQERVGVGTKPFVMYKFRSMRTDTEQDLSMTEKNDNRCTPFGRFIRRFSIDELPQLFNVLKGNMSLVGPRPEIPFYVDKFRKSVPLYMVKHYVKPGITGWAQVNDLRGGDTSISERIKYDIYYIENWSVIFDFKILLKTLIKAVFSKNAR